MKKYILLLTAVMGMSLTSCDDILDRPDKNSPTDEAFWKSEGDLNLYANGFYTEYFVGYNSGWGTTYTPVRGLTFCDDFATTGKQTGFLNTLPEDLGSTSSGTILSQTAGQTWNFSQVRHANVMLDRMESQMKGILSEEAFNHWYAVGQFFKSFEYVRLVTSFGDVPYYEHEVSSTDFDQLYKDRDSRVYVMDKVYDMCKNIMQNMRTDAGTNMLNRYVAAGFISRWMLFEGTWEKYHENNDAAAKKYLEFAVEAADYVINSGKYSIATCMPELFGSQSLAGNPECLLYRAYSDAEAVRHHIASYCNGTENPNACVNLDFLKSVICQDGRPYTTSSIANADVLTVQNIAATRDPRFESCFSDVPSKNCATLIYGRKFIDRYAWTLPEGHNDPLYTNNTNVNDAPVMRYGEVLINWIEAKAELATLGGTAVTQADIDKSINALRDRPLDATAVAKGLKNTAHMMLADIDASFDPNRDADVSPLLWEIRRERRLEMVFEYSRLVDIRRWKKLDYMNNSNNIDTMLGPWIDFNTDLTTLLKEGETTVVKADGTEVTYDGNNIADMVGYYKPTKAVARDKYEDRNYLYPVGTEVIAKYEAKGYKLTQTKRW